MQHMKCNICWDRTPDLEITVGPPVPNGLECRNTSIYEVIMVIVTSQNLKKFQSLIKFFTWLILEEHNYVCQNCNLKIHNYYYCWLERYVCCENLRT